MELNNDLEFTSSILKNKDNLLYVISNNFDMSMIDFENVSASTSREACICIVDFYKKYNCLLSLEQAEKYLLTVHTDTAKVSAILLYIKEAHDFIPIQNIAFLIDLIKKNYGLYTIKQSLFSSLDSLDAQDLDGTVSKIVSGLAKVNAITSEEVDEGNLAQNLDAFYDDYQKIQRGEKTVGVPTGFNTFDRLTGGLKSGELDIVIAGSNEGKSVCMLNIAHHAHVVLKKNVVYFSLELPKAQIMRRYMALAANVNIDRFRDATLTPEENTKLLDKMEELKHTENIFYIVDNPACNAAMIQSKIEELSLKHKIDLVVIDYLAIMKTQNPTGQGWQDLGNMALAVRRIARTFDIPVLTAMQVKVESIKNTKNPVYNMTDIASSFMVIHHADTVMSLKLQNAEAAALGLSTHEMIASIAKCRDGQKGQFSITAVFDRMRMSEVLTSGNF
jgi:replicative DNA helicase